MPNKLRSTVLIYDLFLCYRPKFDMPVILVLYLTAGGLVNFKYRQLIFEVLQYIFPEIWSYSKLELLCFPHLLITFCFFESGNIAKKFSASLCLKMNSLNLHCPKPELSLPWKPVLQQRNRQWYWLKEGSFFLQLKWKHVAYSF